MKPNLIVQLLQVIILPEFSTIQVSVIRDRGTSQLSTTQKGSELVSLKIPQDIDMVHFFRELSWHLSEDKSYSKLVKKTQLENKYL